VKAASFGSAGHCPGSLVFRPRNCEAALSKKLLTSKFRVDALAM